MQGFFKTLWRLIVLAILAVVSAGVTVQPIEGPGSGPSNFGEAKQFLFMTGFVWAIVIFYWYRKDRKAQLDEKAKQAQERENRIQEQVEVARRVGALGNKDGT